jgi:dipeptidyl aminopeptidase/acylaminoacyl peptidase
MNQAKRTLFLAALLKNGIQFNWNLNMQLRARNFSVLAIVFLLTWSASMAQDNNAKRTMELDDLYRFQRVAEPTFSRDGKWIAYQQSSISLDKNESKTAIYMVPTDGSAAPKLLTSSGKKDSRPRFSPDSRNLVFESNRSGSMQLWIIDIHGGEARQLTTIATEATTAQWSPDGKKIAFVSAVLPEHSEKPFVDSDKANREANENSEKSHTKARIADRLFFRHWDSYVEGKRQHLFVLNLKLGASGLEADGEPHDATPGDRDAYPTSSTFSSGEDFTFSPDNQHLIFTAVPATNESWSTNYDICRVKIDNRSNDWETLTQNQAADSGPRISPDGKWVAWRSQSKVGYEADVWNISFAAIEPDGRFTDSKIDTATQGVDSVGEFSWITAQSIVYSTDSHGAQRLVALSFAKNSSTLTRHSDFLPIQPGLFSGLNSHPTGLVFSRSQMNQPAEIYLHANKGPETNMSQANRTMLNEIQLNRPESIDSIPIEGNRKMQMWLLKPPNFDTTKKYPCVYLVHGGPQGAWEDGWSNRWCPQIWAAQGYVIAMPNPRGSTGFGKEFVEQISGDWGGKCYRDLMAGADYVETLPYIDKSRIAAAGASFGGYMMNWFAVNTDRFCCLITHCSVWNFESMWGTTDELWFDEFEHGGLPWEKPEKYREFSPHVKAGKLGTYKTPMLVIHNDLDFRCPIGQGLELFTSLQRQGVPSRFVNFPDEGHWVNKPANSKLWHQEIFNWLAKHCPTKN